MRLIKPKAELLLQQPGLEGVYKQIELAGRTCYKSEDKITKGSAEKFVDRMLNSKHTAMLEHGTVYLKMPGQGLYNQMLDHTYKDYLYNPYSKVILKLVKENPEDPIGLSYAYITTNFRVITENGWFSDLQYICDPTKYHEKRYTFKLTTDRGVSHELVRHRVFSFAQESTRYCNYSKDKFGNEITFIFPSWYSSMDVFHKERFENVLSINEEEYFNMIKAGYTPQQARQILPNALKTEIIMTGFADDWKHFFDLRFFGKTGAPHPDMVDLAGMMAQEADEHGIWEELCNENVEKNVNN